MGSMTFAEAAEHVLRETRVAMPIKALWAEIAKRRLVETEGETPEATLQVVIARRSVNSSVARRDGPPLFYRKGDGTYGLLAHLSPEQQRAVTAAARGGPDPAVDAMSKLASEREDPEFARLVFESMIEDEDSRLAIASLFAKLIQDAHAIHSGCWKVTVRPKDWRLVIGPVRIAKLSRRRLALLTVSDLEQLVPEVKTLVGDVATVHSKPPPRGVDQGVYRILHPEHGQHRVNAVYAAVRPIATASAKRGRQAPNPRTHSPGAIEYLSKLLGLQLPQPIYTGPDDDGEAEGEDEEDDDAADAKLTLDELLAEYIGDYLASPQGKQFMATYEAERHTARANFERIEALRQRGADPTDAILLGLLPHTDTLRHRQQGAWICHAPTINGDIRTWFERSEWVRRQDWPGVARVIFQLVRACVREPDKFRDHIAAFIAEPLSKGFGVGMLTPILNALAPDHFPLCNSKVIRLSHTSGPAISGGPSRTMRT